MDTPEGCRYRAVRWNLDRGLIADSWEEIVAAVHAWMREQPRHTVVWVHRIDADGNEIPSDYGAQPIRSIHMDWRRKK